MRCRARIQRARLELQLAVGEAGDLLQQAVAMALLGGQRQQDVKFNGS